MENTNRYFESLPKRALVRIDVFRIQAFLLPALVMSFLVLAGATIRVDAAVYPGTLTTSDPTFNRPSTCSTLATAPNGSAVRYDAIPFTVTTAGTVTISFELADGGQISPTGTSGVGPDTFLVLYSGSFNPATPLTNCFTFNDDINSGLNRRSRIITSLAAGSYTVVVTSFRNVPINTTDDDVLPWNYSLAVLNVPTYGPSDFLVSDFLLQRIAVFDQNLVFKHYLDAHIQGAHGLDFLPNGNVAALARDVTSIKIYNPLGVVVGGFGPSPSFTGSSQDMKVSSNNLIYVGSTITIPELNLSGTKLRGFGVAGSGYSNVVLLPGNKMWASNGSTNVDVFDLSTGSGNNIPPISSFSINNNGQTNSTTMVYSASTNTVLMTNNGGDVFERNANTGAFVRKFVMSAIPPGTFMAQNGVTRGPGGDVYVTTQQGGSDQRVARFNGTTGAFISSANISQVSTPAQIIWAGNSPALRAKTTFDFDGDNKTDISIFRPSNGQWWINRSSTGVTFATQFGNSSDRITPGDFTGDGKADIAFWRSSSGFWFVLRSEDSTFFSFPYGTNGDYAAPADFDGDGKFDAAVYRASETNWYIRRSSDGGSTITQFGAAMDAPVPADYDGDGKADIAIYRGLLGQWWINRSSNGSVVAFQFGSVSDRPTVGDFTGDGKTDIAFWRQSNGTWFVLRSEDSSFFSFPFGASGDIVAPGDYDGDGRTDAGVFRPSEATWYIQRSTAGILIQAFGANGDRPLPNSYVPF